MNWDMHWLTTALDGFLAFVPSLVAGLLILFIGYVAARILASVTRSLLHRIGFDRLAARTGMTTANEPDLGSRWAGSAVFTVVILATVMQVARTWNLTFVAVGFARLIAYLPHVLGAAVIFGAAMVFGNWLRDRVLRSPMMTAERAENGGGQLRLVPSVVRGAVLVVGAFMALRELQIAPEIVDAAFTLTLGAIAVAAALAFGLGGREVAGRIAQSWYDRRREPRGDYSTQTRPGLSPGLR